MRLLVGLVLFSLLWITPSSGIIDPQLQAWQRTVVRCMREHCDASGGYLFPNNQIGSWMPIPPNPTVSIAFAGPVPAIQHLRSPPLDSEQADGLEHHHDMVYSSAEFPWWFRGSLFWTCERNCRYESMILDREVRKRTDEPAIKYTGKWPFDRVLGIQEWFSSIFSIGNGLVHLYYVPKLIWPATPLASLPLTAPSNFRLHWISFAFIAMNTWLWSAVFHAMDTAVTEDLDYFCAFAIIIWGLWVAASRTLLLSHVRQLSLLIFLLTLYGIHLNSMIHHFDYGYNTLVNAFFAFISSFFWLYWALQRRDRHYVWILVLAIVGVYPMTLLEFFDFPPLFNLLDAHALWHLSTIPFSFVMYEGVIRDLQFEAKHTLSLDRTA